MFESHTTLGGDLGFQLHWLGPLPHASWDPLPPFHNPGFSPIVGRAIHRIQVMHAVADYSTLQNCHLSAGGGEV